MNELIKGIPEIVRSVTDPFSLLALMVVVLGVVAYLAIRTTAKSQESAQRWPASVALAIVAISFVAFALNVLRFSNLQTNSATHSQSRYSLQVTFRGTRLHSQAVTVPFRTSSGQLNVGCTDAVSTTVSWNLPAGAREIHAAASWQNTDNLKNQSQQAVVSGLTAVATGSLRGRDREWTGNCPGGGHGELVLSGDYIIDQVGAEEALTLKNFQDVLLAKSEVRIPIPSIADVKDPTCDISVSEVDTGGETSKLTVRLKANPDGTYSIMGGSHPESTKITTRIDGSDLIVRIA
jgi:hypothetical protein